MTLPEDVQELQARISHALVAIARAYVEANYSDGVLFAEAALRGMAVDDLCREQRSDGWLEEKKAEARCVNGDVCASTTETLWGV